VSALAAELLATLELLGLRRVLPAAEAVLFVFIVPILCCPLLAHYKPIYQRNLIKAPGFSVEIFGFGGWVELPINANAD
jgi:hypothetical protein